MSPVRLFALVLWVGSALPVAAQSPSGGTGSDYLVDRLTVEDGLPAIHATGVAFDDAGYLWVSTFDGLARFDGRRFTVYDVTNTPALTSNRLSGLTDAGADGIWFQAEDATLYRLADGQISRVPLPLHARPYLIDADGVWLVSSDGLWRWADGTLERMWASSIDGWTFGVMRDADGTTWVALADAVVAVGPDGRARRTLVDPAWAPFEARRWRDGSVHLVTRAGTARLVGGRFVLDQPGALDLEPGQPAPVGRTWFYSPTAVVGSGALARPTVPMGGGELGPGLGADARSRWRQPNPVRDAEGRAWSVTGGWLVRDGERILQVDPTPGVGNHERPQIRVGPNGLVWLATSRGLLRVRRRLVGVVGEPEGLGGANVYPVLATRDGSVLAGVWSGDSPVVRIGREGRPQPAGYPRSLEVPVALLETADGSVWVSASSGLYVLPAGGQREARSAEGLPLQPGISAMLEARDGALWLGSEVEVSRSVRRADGTWASRAWPLAHRAQALVETRAGDVLVATAGSGLGRVVGDGVEWLTPDDGLASAQVRDVYEDERGVLWIATQDRGLCRLDRGGDRSLLAGRLGCLSTAHGLHHNSLHRVIPDDDGRLWINSNGGIFALARTDADAVALGARETLSVVALTETDGLRNQEGNGGRQPAGSRSADGRIWFPTQAGVAVVDPAAIGRPPPPVARVEALVVGDRALGREAVVTMGPGERDLRVQYTGISFTDPGAVRFRTRLVGYDDRWRDLGDAREDAFTNLPPGTFTFEVQANIGGVWGAPDAVAVVREPRVWETLWFRLLALLGVGVAIGGAVRWRLGEARRRQRELEATVAERTADLTRRTADLSERTDELARAHAVQSRFLANVSHELRTPLALLLGPLRDLRAGRLSEADARALLARSEVHGARLTRLIDDLLTLARLDGGALVPRREPVDLGAFVAQRAAAFRAHAEAARLTLDVVAGPVSVAADPSMAETVVYNLIGNALKFTPAGGTVTVRVEPADGGARLLVADTGRGIAEADLPHLFDRFYQADTPQARAGDGAGIGLSLVREFVALHRGTIGVESTPGEGTTVTVWLPAGVPDAPPSGDGSASVLPALPAVPASHVAPLDGDDEDDDDRPLVLVVEDHPDLRHYLRTLLGDGYRVVEAADGAEGLARALDLVPDLVLSDVMMPGLDGFGVLAALKADVRTSHVPVVLLTARADAESRLAGLTAGADAYLAKPFDGAEVAAVVEGLLANRERLRQAWAATHRPAPRPAADHDDAPPVGGDSELAAPHPPELADVAAPEPPLPPVEAAFLERVDAALDEHLADATFGAAELAEAVGLSPRQLRRKLDALTGESASQRVRRVRVERAAVLLASGELSVKEVQYAVGFSSGSGFRSAFKDVHGTSPSEYAESVGA